MSFKKKAIPQKERRKLAKKYGCGEGETLAVCCHYCGKAGKIVWWNLSSGKPSAWVSFTDITIDHVVPESKGGRSAASNLVLACERCNKSKKDKLGADYEN